MRANQRADHLSFDLHVPLDSRGAAEKDLADNYSATHRR